MVVEADSLDLFAPACRRRHRLARLMAGELVGDEAQAERAHLAGCAHCQSQWRELEAEAREVREVLPFEKLQERLARPPAKVVPLSRFRKVGPIVGLALAATLAAVVLSKPKPIERNGTKGGIALDVFVGGTGEPRRVDAPSIALAPGDRVRLKVNGDGRRFVAVVSIDDAGHVSPIYFQNGESLPLESGARFLPQSIDFDGRGSERLVVLLSAEPLREGAIEDAARAAFGRAGGLAEMKRLELGDGVEELDRTVVKAERP